MIPEDVIADIKARADLAAVIGRTVKLKRVGRNLVGLCPFHTEKTPSFNVRPDEGFFFCFGCKAAGDVVEFLVRTTGRGFLDIITDLAHETGVELPKVNVDPREEARQQERKKLLRVLELAQVFFRTRLASDQGAAARAYLKDVRKFDDDAIDRFGLGFAGSVDDGLATFLKEQGISADEAILAGVCSRSTRDERQAYDFFRHRITFPVRGARGEVLSFSGRIFGEREKAPDGTKRPKYINGPQSPVYDKSQVLYGLSESLPALKKGEPLVLTEGAVDAIAVHRAGVHSAVAPCGTTLTPRHLDEIKRRTARVVLCLDADKAGREAAARSTLMMLAADLDVSVVALPDKDPDQMVAAGRADELRGLILGAPSALDARIADASKRAMGSVQARVKALDELLPFLAAPARELVRTNAIRAVGRAFNEDEQVIAREVEKRGRRMISDRLRSSAPATAAPARAAARAPNAPGAPAPAGHAQPHAPHGNDPRATPSAEGAAVRRATKREPPFSEPETMLAEALLTHPHLAARCGVLTQALKNRELRAFVTGLIDLFVRFHDVEPRQLLARVLLRPGGEIPKLLEKLLHAGAFARPDAYLSEPTAARIVEDMLLTLDVRTLERRLGEVQPLLMAADERGDDGERKRLVAERSALVQAIRDLQAPVPRLAEAVRAALPAGPVELLPPAAAEPGAAEEAPEPPPTITPDDMPYAGDPDDDPYAV